MTPSAAPPDFRAWVEALPPSPGHVHVHLGEIAEIVLDAPHTRNALTPRMMVQLADAVDAVAGARVVVLHGTAGAFCSGGDLGSVREHLGHPGMGACLAGWMHATTERLRAHAGPVIAALEGPALGGGAELLTAVDYVIARPDARIGWVQARLGVTPGFGGGTRLVERVGPARALALLGDAHPVTGAEALAIGLVDELADHPLTAARERAARWCRLPPDALRAVHRVVRAAATLPHHEALAAEATLFDQVWGRDEHRAALDAAVRRPEPR